MLGIALQRVTSRERASRRGAGRDDPELPSHLGIEERELEAGGLN